MRFWTPVLLAIYCVPADPATAASPYPRFTGQSSWSDSEYIAAPDNEVVQFEPADFWSGKHRMRRADENLITSCPGLDGDAVYIDFLENQNFSLDTLSKDLTPGQLRNLTLFNSRNQKLLNRTALYAEIGILAVTLVLSLFVYRYIIRKRKKDVEKAEEDAKKAREELARKTMEEEDARLRQQKKENQEMVLKKEVTKLAFAKRREKRKFEQAKRAATGAKQRETSLLEKEVEKAKKSLKEAREKLIYWSNNQTEWEELVETHKRLRQEDHTLSDQLATLEADVGERETEMKAALKAKKDAEEERDKQVRKRLELEGKLKKAEEDEETEKDLYEDCEDAENIARDKMKIFEEATSDLPKFRKNLQAAREQLKKDNVERSVREQFLNRELAVLQSSPTNTSKKEISAHRAEQMKLKEARTKTEGKISNLAFSVAKYEKVVEPVTEFVESTGFIVPMQTIPAADFIKNALETAEKAKDAQEKEKDRAHSATKLLQSEIEKLEITIAGLAINVAINEKNKIAIEKTLQDDESSGCFGKSRASREKIEIKKLKDEQKILHGRMTELKTEIGDLAHGEKELENAKAEIQKNNLLIANASTRMKEALKQLDSVARSYGINRRELDRVIATYEYKSEQLRVIQKTVKTAEQAATEGERLRAKVETVSRTRDLRKEFVNVDVMNTVLAEEIAARCAIRCNHESKEHAKEASSNAQSGVMARQMSRRKYDLPSKLNRMKQCPWHCDALLTRIDNVVDGKTGKTKVQQKKGDFVLWRPDRKSNEVCISVFESKEKGFHVIKFRIDTGRGCLIQKGVPDNVRPVLSKMPKGCVGVSLASAVNTRNKESMNLEYIKCYLPEDPMSNGAPREILLKRQLVVCSDDAANISKEVYQAKWFYIGFFLFELFDWMTDWGFFFINTRQDVTLKCDMDDTGSSLTKFKYDEYEQAVLWFNIIGTIAVFPVEIWMVIVRLVSSVETAEKWESWVSTGMLISIFLEDLPQLILQALYFAKSKREMGVVNGTSIVMTILNLIVSIALSWTFIQNFYYTYIRPNADRVGEREDGDFKREMWKLGTIVLFFASAFDMIAAWCFFSLVLENPELHVQGDFEAAGQDWDEYRAAWIAVACLQTVFAAPVRIITCIRLFTVNAVEKGTGAVAEKTDAADTAGVARKISAGLAFGPVLTVTACMVDVPSLFLHGMYMANLGSPRNELSAGYKSMAAFSLFFNVALIVAAALLSYRYLQLLIRPVFGRKATKRTSWNEPAYKKRGYQIALALQIMVALATAGVSWIFWSATTSERFSLARERFKEDTSADPFHVEAANFYSLMSIFLAVIISAHALYFSYCCLQELGKMMPPYNGGLWEKLQMQYSAAKRNEWAKAKRRRVPGTEVEKFDSKGYEKGGRIAEPHLAWVAGIGFFPFFALLLTIASYHNTMSQANLDAHLYYDACLPAPANGTFESCARDEMLAAGLVDEPAVTLGPSSSINAALGLCMLQVVISIGYAWAYFAQTLNQKESEKMTMSRNSKIRYIFTWFPSLAVILVQANWAVSAWFFFVNGIDGIGAQARDVIEVHRGGNRTVSLNYKTYRKAMLIFPAIGCTVVWLAMAYAGYTFMESNAIKSIKDSKKKYDNAVKGVQTKEIALQVVQNDADAPILVDDDEPAINEQTSEEFGGFENLNKDQEDNDRKQEYVDKVEKAKAAVMEAKKTFYSEKENYLEAKRTPGYMVATFLLNVVCKAVPHLILTAIFVNTTSSNGAATYCLLSIIVDLLVSFRVLSAYLGNIHPTFELLAWVEGITMVSTFLAWRLEVVPVGSAVWSKLGLATSVLLIVWMAPFFYICYGILKSNSKTIHNQRRRSSITFFDRDEQGNNDIYIENLSDDGSETFDGFDDTPEKNRVNAVDAKEKDEFRVRVSSGIKVLAGTHWIPTMFLAMFFLNTVPNMVFLGGHVYESGRGEAAVLFAILANCGSGAFSLFIGFWWARNRSITFCYTYTCVFVNSLGVWLFLAAIVFPHSKVALMIPGVGIAVLFVVLSPILLLRTWRLRKKTESFTHKASKTFNGRKGIELFVNETEFEERERIDNRTVGLFFMMFVWNCGIVVLQLNWLYSGTIRLRLAEFTLFCTISSAVAFAFPPMVWLRQRHIGLGYMAAGLFVLFVLIWWTWAVAFFPVITGHSLAALVLNLIATFVGFPLLLFMSHKQLLRAKNQSISTNQYPAEQLYVNVSNATLTGGKLGTATVSPADEFAKRRHERKTNAYFRIDQSGICVESRKRLFDLIVPFEQFIRDLLTNEATGSFHNYALRIRCLVVLHILWGTASIGVCIQGLQQKQLQSGDGIRGDFSGSGSDNMDSQGASGSGDTRQMEADATNHGVATLHGAIAIISMFIAFGLVLLGWWANRCGRALFFYSAIEMFSWMTMLSLFNGPLGTSHLTALIVVASIATITMFVQFALAAAHFNGTIDSLFWGWGQDLGTETVMEETFKEKWLKFQKRHGTPPVIWFGLGILPIIFRHAPVVVIIVVSMQDSGAVLHATNGFALTLASVSLFVCALLVVLRISETCALYCSSSTVRILQKETPKSRSELAMERAEKRRENRELLEQQRRAKKDPDEVAKGEYNEGDPRCTYLKDDDPSKRCKLKRVKNSAFCQRHTCERHGCVMFKFSANVVCEKHKKDRNEMDAMFAALPEAGRGSSGDTFLGFGEEQAEIRLALDPVVAEDVFHGFDDIPGLAEFEEMKESGTIDLLGGVGLGNDYGFESAGGQNAETDEIDNTDLYKGAAGV